MQILPFRPEDQSSVRDLILAGLAEHWGVLDESRNPDLDDIAAVYAHTTFLVVHFDGRIVGAGAFVPVDAHTVQIVRMSVARDVRRRGIGTALLRELCRCARAAGYQRAILETTSWWSGVIAFYERFGFQVTHTLGDDTYMALEL